MSSQLPLLINSASEAKDGIRRFQDELTCSSGIVDLLSSFQAWYAISDAEGRILLAPSKFIGYQGLTAETYRAVNRDIDGRATETVLSRWFSQPDTQSEQALIQALAKLLSRYGKKPNKRARVSTLNGLAPLTGAPGEQSSDGPSALDALMIFYRMLSEDDRREFRRRISR
jgi:hypothetical protein